MNNVTISPELEMYRPEVIASPKGEALAVRFEVGSLLEAKIGLDWQDVAREVVTGSGVLVVRTGDHHTVREPIGKFGLISVEGDKFAEAVPGIWELYQGIFKQMMQVALPAGLEPYIAMTIHGLHLRLSANYSLTPVQIYKTVMKPMLINATQVS